jgi:hypothetical protein
MQTKRLLWVPTHNVYLCCAIERNGANGWRRGAKAPLFLYKSLGGGYLVEMHILQVSASPQSITIIPRSFPASVTIQLIDESTNTTATPAVTAASANGFMTLTGTFSLVNNRFYGLKVFNSGNLIYRDRVFVTSQTEYDKFTVNQNVYTEETSYDNDYIII